jgi:hypothetical protein
VLPERTEAVSAFPAGPEKARRQDKAADDLNNPACHPLHVLKTMPARQLIANDAAAQSYSVNLPG